MSDIEAIKARHEEHDPFFAGRPGIDVSLRAHADRATLLSALTASEARAKAAEARVRKLEKIRKAARQIIQGASGHYMNAEDRWILERRLDDYDTRTLKGTPDGR